MRRARKKASELEHRELYVEDIAEHLDTIYDLYRDIAANSGFNMVNLNKNYLLNLKQQFPDRFRLFGYFLGGELIGFYTTIQNQHEMEAHFLGFQRQYNASHLLYLNMLYDMVEIGINQNASRIVFARTAMAIKSSVGAVAHEMFCYLRHRNSFTNKFVKPLLEYLRPSNDWEARHPFKSQGFR